MNLDVQQPLRRGIFVSTSNQGRVWVLFKYERLLNFCFGCGCMGHCLKECSFVFASVKEQSKNELPYTLALKTESNLMGK